MADPNHPNSQFGQNYQQQYRPPLPNQGVPNHSSASPHGGQGPLKPGNMPPGPGQQYPGPLPNNFMNTGQPPRFPPQGNPGAPPPQTFGAGPPPPMGGGVNGVMPPNSQGMQRPQVGGMPPPAQGNFRPPVSGQFMPPGSNNPSAFGGRPPLPSGPRPAANGTTNTPPPMQGAGGQPPRFYPPSSMPQGGPMPPGPGQGGAPPRPGAPPTQPGPPPHSNSGGQPRMMVTPPTGNTGPLKPPSQRSSRGPSPVSEQSYDALEGQFSPNAGTPAASASAPAFQGAQGSAPQVSASAPGIPGPAGQGARVPFLPPQAGGPGVPPGPNGARMPGPPGLGMPGPPGPGMPGPPLPASNLSRSAGNVANAPPQPQMMPSKSTPLRPAYPQMPPTGPYNAGPPSAGQPSNSQPYFQPAGPGSGLPAGPPMGSAGPPTGPPGPPSGPPGPPTGPPGPPSGPPGPPSGPAGPPSGPAGPYRQPGPGYSQPGPGYPQPGTGYPPAGAGQNAVNKMAGDFSNMGVNDTQRPINLLQEKRLITADGIETVRPALYHDLKRVNCNPEVFRCTLNAIPQTSALLNKARLPLGILIHPFKDLSQLPVIQSSVIVRCRSCRTYINPFVTFVDQRRWKCNLCFRVNELPDEFSFDPVTKTYGDPQRRPEIRSATIEFIAPSEYMLRPPQPAVYLFLLDVSFNAIETGYLRLFTQILVEELERLPGDARMQVGFLCYDRSLYFFNLAEGLSQPQMMVVPDLEDVFLPCPDNLLVNLHESKDLVTELLAQLPGQFEDNKETGSALGTALQAAFKLMTSTGGRITVMQTTLPNVGQGSLEPRESGSQNASLSTANLGPATDFYKKLALDCSAQQVAVDLFLLNGQYADIASMSCISKYSAGSVQHYPSFHTAKNPGMSDKFESDLRRYLTRKIGFESVMRIRCTRGLSIHTFHGNFFVRSTDLLSLPNVNPDAGFGMQMSIEDNLTESSNVCFQAALLYTSSKGERRIRVHTLCVPITNQLSEVFAGADQQAMAALLSKMAVDRTISSSLEDARDAMMNACLDMLSAYATQVPGSQRVGALVVPHTLRLVPLLTLAMLKSDAFRLSSSVRLDTRVFAQLMAKTMPTNYLVQSYYPHLYPVHALNDENVIQRGNETIPKGMLLQLSSANIDRHGVYLLDQGEHMILLVGGAVSDAFCADVFDVPNFMSIPEGMTDLPELENPTSERLRCFINYLMDSRPGGVTFIVLREDSKMRHQFFQYMVEDRTENSMSYYEFLQFLQQKVKG